MKTLLVAKRDVKGFCLTDVDGYETIFNLKAGSTIEVYAVQDFEPYDENDHELYVDLNPCETVIVDNRDFDVVKE